MGYRWACTAGGALQEGVLWQAFRSQWKQQQLLRTAFGTAQQKGQQRKECQQEQQVEPPLCRARASQSGTQHGLWRGGSSMSR
jgi:hypothetical protein